MDRVINGALVVLVALTAGIGSAMAGVSVPVTPAPVLGLGIPALAGFALLYRKLRSRKD